MICSNCGKENKDSVKFCAYCGNRFLEEVPSVKVCPACSKENAADKKFCIFCGTKFDSASEAAACVEENCRSEVHTAKVEEILPESDPVVTSEPVVDISKVQEVTPVDAGVNRCTQCFKDNLPGARFCLYCGNTLSGGTVKLENAPQKFEVTQTPAKKKKGGKIALVIIIILLVLGAALGGLYYAYEYTDLFSFLDSESTARGSETTQVTTETVADTEPVINETETTISTETEAENSLENIVDETGTLLQTDLSDLNALISGKEKESSLDIYMMLVKDSSAAKKNAEDIVKEKGDKALCLVVGVDDKTTVLLAGTKAEKQLNKVTSDAVLSEIEKDLEYRKYLDACKRVASIIYPDEEAASYEMVEGSQQVVYVTKDKGANTGKLALVDWTNGPKVVYAIDKVYLGRDGITTSPSESKCATPQGTFELGFAFSDDTLNTKLDSIRIVQGDVWVDDPSSEYYNTLQSDNSYGKDWSSAEDTYNIFKGGYNNACILIEHNGNGYTAGVSGKGSCIYLAGKEKDLTTSYGDVNISASQMTTLLSYLDEILNPHIVIR